MEKTKQEEMALFKYRVISVLLDGQLTIEQERAQRKEVLEKQWEFPDGSKGKIKPRTLRHWLEKYRKNGFDGLYYCNKQAKRNKGICRAISPNLLDVARELREENKSRSVEQILELMQHGKSLDVSAVNPRTLMRYFKRLGLKKGRSSKGKGQHERYGQESANILWHGDTAQTFSLADPYNPGQVKKARLVVFIDDATRVCPHGEFYFDEQLPSVLDTLSKALLRRGKPTRILLDNAKTFRSTTLELMCAELDIGLNFCRPRRPQGKGKIERYIRTLKESFILEAKKAPNINTLEELNAAFQGWLELYGNRVHSELEGLTPEQRWARDEYRINRSLTENQIRQAMMLRADRTVQFSTALVLLNNREYQASRELAGQEVQIRWNPERQDQIQIWMEGRYLETALLKERKAHVERDWRQDEPEDIVASKLESAGEYCAALMQDRVGKQRRKDPNDLCRLEDFEKLLATCVRPFDTEEELEQITEHFRRFGPLRKTGTEEKLMQMVAEKGADRGLRAYLERLEPKAIRR
ncbi:MAG: DDE-type integrase/transposase/recombinase [Candidatus Obscuribacterales bacterium]|nr:DDE-type integrase/transposase/recombinase [Candidatus Obscuribacterales bacterium]